MLYRVQQFFQALFPRITAQDRILLDTYLPVAARSLFQLQSPVDQRHALDVAWDLMNSPETKLSPSSTENLVLAALLHDCGKGRYPLKIWQRVYIVLCANLPHNIQDYLKGLERLTSLSMPLQLAQNHPRWGAEMASAAHLPSEVIEFIRDHHCPTSDAGRLLYLADNRH